MLGHQIVLKRADHDKWMIYDGLPYTNSEPVEATASTLKELVLDKQPFLQMMVTDGRAKSGTWNMMMSSAKTKLTKKLV